MENVASSKLMALVHFIKSLHVYIRYEISKHAKSTLVYGVDFGDANILKRAKEDFLKKQNEYQNRDTSEVMSAEDKLTEKPEKSPFGGIYAFPDKTAPEANPDGLQMEAIASTKRLSDFTGKDYLFDISPQSVFIIFPDITFTLATKFLMDISWEYVRTELQESGLLDKDIAHLSGEAVSLDELRKKLKDTTSTDGALIDLRKKFYGIAYAINESFQIQVKSYEK